MKQSEISLPRAHCTSIPLLIELKQRRRKPLTLVQAQRWLILAVLLTAWCGAGQENLLSVRNVAALQAIDTGTLGNNNAVLVLGYYIPGDRGGGVFKWQPNSGAPPDGGRYLVSTNPLSPPGRWERMLTGEPANVKMWGARGNIGPSVHPYEVAAADDDTVAIQNALNALPGVGNNGGFFSAELLIPAGFYKVSNTLVGRANLVKIRGENGLSALVMPPGVEKDIFRTVTAQRAITVNDGTAAFDDNVRIEDLSFRFAGYSTQSPHNMTNAALVICQPMEGTTIRNVSTVWGGYGIRCFGGGLGAPAAFRDIVCTDAAIAGICIEPVPGGDVAGGHVSITGITGDHRWDDSAANTCLVKFVNFIGIALIQDLNAEAAYGGGVIQHNFPEVTSGFHSHAQLGLLTIQNCATTLAPTFSGYILAPDFLVLKGGERTASVMMNNIVLYNGNLIRDELTGRKVPPHDAYAAGFSQGSCRVPTSYEAMSTGSYKRSRLVVGDKAIYSFTPPQTGWYRVMEAFPVHGQWRLGGNLEISGFCDSSEFSVDLLASDATDAAALNVIRPVKDGLCPPCVTKARAGVYTDAQTIPYGFVDIFVERLVADPHFRPITLAYPIFSTRDLKATGGATPLLAPTTPLLNGAAAPVGYTLSQCVTNSLIRGAPSGLGRRSAPLSKSADLQ